jgi:hypothetical protein
MNGEPWAVGLFRRFLGWGKSGKNVAGVRQMGWGWDGVGSFGGVRRGWGSVARCASCGHLRRKALLPRYDIHAGPAMHLVIIILLIILIAILAPAIIFYALAIIAKIVQEIGEALPVIAGLMVLLAVIIAVYVIVHQPPPKRERKSRARRQPPGDAQPSINPEYCGPGKYKICGVDRESQMDTVWYCTAQSRDNAKTKAELEGIAVTQVEPVEALQEVSE